MLCHNFYTTAALKTVQRINGQYLLPEQERSAGFSAGAPVNQIFPEQQPYLASAALGAYFLKNSTYWAGVRPGT